MSGERHGGTGTGPSALPTSEAVLNALPLPVLTIGPDEHILHCNRAAESFS